MQYTRKNYYQLIHKVYKHKNVIYHDTPSPNCFLFKTFLSLAL